MQAKEFQKSLKNKRYYTNPSIKIIKKTKRCHCFKCRRITDSSLQKVAGGGRFWVCEVCREITDGE